MRRDRFEYRPPSWIYTAAEIRGWLLWGALMWRIAQ